jgi:hypothetical protein
MNLRELRNMDTHESRTELIDLLDRLKRMFKKKWEDLSSDKWIDYLKELDCECKFSDIPYKDGPEFINVMFYPNRDARFSRKRYAWHIKVPVEIAERVLVLGLP